MNIHDAAKVLRNLKPGEHIEMYKGARGTIISATRTDRICPHDFAVGLKIPGRDEFYPTHIRLLFDLYLKRLSNEKDAHYLFCTLEKVYDGDDPVNLAPQVLKLIFPMQLDDPDVNLYYAQLLMIEQEFNYGPQGCKKGKVHPPKEFLMRFVRWVASGEEIDRIIFLAVSNIPPPQKYAKRLQDKKY
ncbi:MAG: hypothetical protein QMD13_04920 [Candidatus Bathyarchaeia archaeon]|nr:hypothetical protein [Candidatus Bathyarchaeia archaeon]